MAIETAFDGRRIVLRVAPHDDYWTLYVAQIRRRLAANERQRAELNELLEFGQRALAEHGPRPGQTARTNGGD